MSIKKFVKAMRLLSRGLFLLPIEQRKKELIVKTLDRVDISLNGIDEDTQSSGNDMRGTSNAVRDDTLAPGIKRLTFEEGREYTKRQAIKHIIATEEHFREGLCSACLLEKHLPALEMYAEEGFSYCVKDECTAYMMLKDLVKEAEEKLRKGISKQDQLYLANKFREVRKRLMGYGETEQALDRLLYEDGEKASEAT